MNKSDILIYLHGVVEYLMLILLNISDTLKHVVQLFLAEDTFRHASCLPLRPFSRILIAAKYLIKLAHPGTNYSILCKTLHFRQTTNATFNVVFEYVAEISG